MLSCFWTRLFESSSSLDMFVFCHWSRQTSRSFRSHLADPNGNGRRGRSMTSVSFYSLPPLAAFTLPILCQYLWSAISTSNIDRVRCWGCRVVKNQNPYCEWLREKFTGIGWYFFLGNCDIYLYLPVRESYFYPSATLHFKEKNADYKISLNKKWNT